VKVVALLTCHNRKDLTVRCLESFFSQSFVTTAPVLGAVVVDDGSSDGTREAVEAAFESVHLLVAEGPLFWARGMQLAESRAVAGRPDYLLWLNDDVTLGRAALDTLISTATTCSDAIVVGALVDPETGAVTYSGVRQARWHPMRTQLVEPGRRPVQADTFNGNVVLVPRRIYERVGPIDGGFAHGQSDFVYGLRARKAGFSVVVAPSTVGTCRRGAQLDTYDDTSLSLRRRWRLIQSPKGLPMSSHARYLRRHGGFLWPLFWVAPYAKLTFSAALTAPNRWFARWR